MKYDTKNIITKLHTWKTNDINLQFICLTNALINIFFFLISTYVDKEIILYFITAKILLQHG
jgi:hypothetical protein